MKSPDEIKKGLELCISGIYEDCCHCAYHEPGNCDCVTDVKRHALAYIQQLEAQNDTIMQSFQRLKKVCVAQGTTIQQLEAERDALIGNVRGVCYLCKYAEVSFDDNPCASCIENQKRNWQWRGVNKEE